jgi:hypothetical protein
MSDAETFVLPAFAQPQIWVDDNAVDGDAMIHFDAEPHLLVLSANSFSMVAAEILNGGHDIDDVGLQEPAVQEWLKENAGATFYCEVDRHAFAAWLSSHGFEPYEIFTMQEDQMEALRNSVDASNARAGYAR